MFQEQFAAFYNENELPDGYSIATLDSLCSIKGGKRLPADGELLDTPTAHPYIRVRDLGSNRYVCLTNQFQYIDEETHSAISRYIVNTNDIVISIVGTIGLIGKIHTSLNNANLTENCVKLANIHTVTPDYLYYTLCYKKQIKEIELLQKKGRKSAGGLFSKKEETSLFSFTDKISHSCYICDRIKGVYERYIATIFYLYEEDSAFVTKFKKSKGFCLEHYGMLFEEAPKYLHGNVLEDFTSDLNRVFLENYKRMEEELAWFIDKFDYRNTDAPWKTSKDAVPRAMTKVNGILSMDE